MITLVVVVSCMNLTAVSCVILRCWAKRLWIQLLISQVCSFFEGFV